MHKKELVSAVAEKAELSKKDSAEAIEALVETITETLADKEDVSITGFGSWKSKERAERRARNPQDGSEVIVPKHYAVSFKAGKNLKEIVKES